MPNLDPVLKKHLRSKALPTAIEAAIQAGEFIRRKFGKYRTLTEKPDATLVTEVDKGSEKLIIRALNKKFSKDRILAEESGLHEKGQGDFRWIIDPLDGTTNFVHHFPMFCVSIGLEYQDHLPVLGVIYQPITGDLYTGIRGEGAFANKKRMKVSKIGTLSDAMLTTGFSYKKELYYEKELQALSRILVKSRALRRTGSAALDLTFVANGQFDGFWEYGLSPWDVAAGIVLLNEAGGKYSRLDGSDYVFGDKTLLASNGLLHSQILDTLQHP